MSGRGESDMKTRSLVLAVVALAGAVAAASGQDGTEKAAIGQPVRDFRKKDVVFLGIKSSAGDSAEEIKKYCETRNFDIPVLVDDRNVVADYFGARSTPQYAVIDTSGVLRYYGAFDDLQTMRTWQK